MVLFLRTNTFVPRLLDPTSPVAEIAHVYKYTGVAQSCRGNVCGVSSLSLTCRRSSFGGWAPYTSRAGMLRSSIKKIIFLPEGGPNSVFRFFSSLVSNMSWKDGEKKRIGAKRGMRNYQGSARNNRIRYHTLYLVPFSSPSQGGDITTVRLSYTRK